MERSPHDLINAREQKHHQIHALTQDLALRRGIDARVV
jgi:hypothetical protein